MIPNHGHIHISTDFMFVTVVLIVAIIALIIWARSVKRSNARQLEADRLDHEYRMKGLDRPATLHVTPGIGPTVTSYPWGTDVSTGGSAPRYPAQPGYTPTQYPAQTVVHTGGGGSDMLTGILIGDMIGNAGHGGEYRETIIHDHTPASDSSSTSDSGLSASWGDSGSSSSSDSGSSSSDSGGGGFDMGW